MLLNKRISIGYFLNTIKYELTAIALYAITIGLLDHFSVFKGFNVPLGLTSIIATAVSILLAFRISQSYERWWEARAVWGAIVNDSRTLIRQIDTFYDGEEKSMFIKDFAHRQIYWCQALLSSLRKTDVPDECFKYLASLKMTDDNIPNGLLSIHSDKLRKALIDKNVNQYQQIQLDNTIVNLCNSMGRCERIKNTVFPKSYSTLIHFLIYLIITVLPFGISDESIVLEVLLCTVIPSVFVAIENTAILMQDPFENLPMDTPMTAITRTIERNLKQMIGESAPMHGPVENTYYVM